MTSMSRWRLVDRIMVLLSAMLSGVAIGLAAWIVLVLMQPVGSWLEIREPLLLSHHGIYRPGDPIVFRLRYGQDAPRAVYIGVTFASTGYLGVTPVMLTALPYGQHEVALQVALPRGLRRGNYRAYVMLASRLGGWGAEPLVVASEAFDVQERDP